MAVMVRLLLAAGFAVLAGCGSEASEPPREASGGRVVVWETLPPQPVYIEGSLGYLRVEAVGTGAVLVDGRVTDPNEARGTAPLFEETVEPGEYRLESHQRPCSGNCSMLDPPADRCAATLDVEPGATVTATIQLAQTGGCSIDVRGGE